MKGESKPISNRKPESNKSEAIRDELLSQYGVVDTDYPELTYDEIKQIKNPFELEGSFTELKEKFSSASWFIELSTYELEHPEEVEKDGFSPEQGMLWLQNLGYSERHIDLLYAKELFIVRNLDTLYMPHSTMSREELRVSAKAINEKVAKHLESKGFSKTEIEEVDILGHSLSTGVIIAKGSSRRIVDVIYGNFRLLDLLLNEDRSRLSQKFINNQGHRDGDIVGWNLDYLPPVI